MTLPKLKHLANVSGSDLICSHCSKPAVIRLNADGERLCAVHAQRKARELIAKVNAAAKGST